MLMAHDISDFNPRVLPKNEYLERMQEETEDPIHKFIEQVEPGEYSGSELYNSYKEFCRIEGLLAHNHIKFGTQLLYLITNGSITRKIDKVKTKKSNNYVIE